MMAARKTNARASWTMATRVWIAVLAVLIGGLTATTASAAVEPDTQVVATGGTQASTGGAATVGGPVKTADLSQFDPGMIISDAVFFDSGTMTEAQIQAFLEAKVPRCEPGYICLKDWYDTSRVTGADAMCGAYAGGMRERASAIIYKVAKACGINPQVILVMLEKEQGLVRHVWPSDWRYTIAMGQGCPDTAACDTRYYGFFNQVYGAAWQLKRYANPAGTSQYFTWYAPGKTWNVRYHPEISCGSSPVRIQNQATANLYYYTPYQPNAAAIRAGYGEGDGCSSYGNRNFFQYFNDWFGSTTGGSKANNPVGFVDGVTSRPGTISVQGWALDPDTSESIDVHIYIDGQGTAGTANLPRPDLAPHYPNLGVNHGYSIDVPATRSGTVEVCAYGINRGVGSNQLLACTTVESYGGSPIGVVDGVTAGPGTISISGWAIDPDTVDPISVHVYVGAAGHALTADKPRDDVTQSHPLYGTAHGYSATLTSAPGLQNVCAYGINVKIGSNVLLSCTQVFVPAATDPGRPPFGNIDAVAVTGDSVWVGGWALDPDSREPIEVHVYVGATGTAHRADADRPDIAAVYPGYGSAHGFSVTATLPPGQSQVCVYAINDGAGGHTLLGCRNVQRPSAAPFGYLDSARMVDGGVSISGWAIDPDVASSIDVHAYVGSHGYALTANQNRPDLAVVYPASGPSHGYSAVLPVTGNDRTVCVYAIDDKGAGNTLLGCRSF